MTAKCLHLLHKKLGMRAYQHTNFEETKQILEDLKKEPS